MVEPIVLGMALETAAQTAPAAVITEAVIARTLATEQAPAAEMLGQTDLAAAMVTPAQIDPMAAARLLPPNAPHRAAARLITSAAVKVALGRIVNAAKPAGPVVEPHVAEAVVAVAHERAVAEAEAVGSGLACANR
jgi:hypothetical protein